LPISPLEGEMPGRAEGGITGTTLNSPLHGSASSAFCTNAWIYPCVWRRICYISPNGMRTNP